MIHPHVPDSGRYVHSIERCSTGDRRIGRESQGCITAAWFVRLQEVE
jgi:hypothetical protein